MSIKITKLNVLVFFTALILGTVYSRAHPLEPIMEPMSAMGSMRTRMIEAHASALDSYHASKQFVKGFKEKYWKFTKQRTSAKVKYHQNQRDLIKANRDYQLQKVALRDFEKRNGGSQADEHIQKITDMKKRLAELKTNRLQQSEYVRESMKKVVDVTHNEYKQYRKNEQLSKFEGTWDKKYENLEKAVNDNNKVPDHDLKETETKLLKDHKARMEATQAQNMHGENPNMEHGAQPAQEKKGMSTLGKVAIGGALVGAGVALAQILASGSDSDSDSGKDSS